MVSTAEVFVLCECDIKADLISNMWVSDLHFMVQ